MMRYEIFDPNNGIPLYTVKYRWMARLIIRLTTKTRAYAALGYAPVGDGWL